MIRLIIEWIEIIIEKEYHDKTVPYSNTPIQYNPINIKRKYYTKNDPEYHRKSFKPISKSSQFNKTVIQEPLLDQDYLYPKKF